MDHALTVRIIEGQAALEDDADDPMQRHQLADRHELVERRTLDVLHREIGALGFDDGVVDLDDIRMVEAAADAALGLETASSGGGTWRHCPAQRDDLDRNFAIGIRIAAKITVAVAPLPSGRMISYLPILSVIALNRSRIESRCAPPILKIRTFFRYRGLKPA